MDVTERPGRKALFSGAGGPAGSSAGSSEEIAAHVRQLNEDIAASLSSAMAGRSVSPLDALKFGAEYTSLIGAVNAALPKLKSERLSPAPAALSGGTGEQSSRYEEIISDLRNRLEMMVDRNPVPMLVTTPAFAITDANDAYVQMSGLRQDELKNTSLAGFKLHLPER